jgi:hypothetical protein
MPERIWIDFQRDGGGSCKSCPSDREYKAQFVQRRGSVVISVAFHPSVLYFATGSWRYTAMLWLLSERELQLRSLRYLDMHLHTSHTSQMFTLLGTEIIRGTLKFQNWAISGYLKLKSKKRFKQISSSFNLKI